MRVRRTVSISICALAAIAGLLALACSPAAAPMRIDSVSPSVLASPQPALLLVTGAGFRQGDTVSLTQGGSVGLNAQALNGSQWINDQFLSAPLPSGLALGRYDLIVTDPEGRQATRPNALQIGASEAARAPATPAPPAATAAPPSIKATLPPTEAPTRTPRPTERPRPTRTPEPPTQKPTETPTETPTPRETPVIPPTSSPAPPTTSGAAGRPLNVSGHWQLVDTIQPAGQQVSFPDLVLTQQGQSVTGDSSNGLVLQGTLSGRTLTATYQASAGTSGTFVWTFAPDGTRFSGSFTATGVNSGDSSGVRSSGEAVPVRTPAQVLILTHGHVQGQGQPASSHGHGSEGGD